MTADKEETRDVLSLAAVCFLPETRVRGPRAEKQEFVGAWSWLSSTTRWGCGYVYGGIASGETDQRMYASSYGRFASPDRYTAAPGVPGSWNRYAYVLGDPINSNDPLGLYACSADDGDDYSCGDDYYEDGGDGGGAVAGTVGPDGTLTFSVDATGVGEGDPLPVNGSLIMLAPLPVTATPGFWTGVWAGLSGIAEGIGAVVATPVVVATTVLATVAAPSAGGWGDTIPTVQQIQQYCIPVGEPVDVPSTNKRNKGGRSVEQLYICPDGSYWTIETLLKPNGGVFSPPHIRPGHPKHG